MGILFGKDNLKLMPEEKSDIIQDRKIKIDPESKQKIDEFEFISDNKNILNNATFNIEAIWITLLYIEFLIRLFLFSKESEKRPHKDKEKLPKWKNLKLGDNMQQTFLTSYRSLTNLVKKFNEHQNSQGDKLNTEKLTQIRNTLAHGQIISEPLSELKIIKFSNKAKNNYIKIELLVEMNE